jgi:DNA helicase-2/ATP-dependent DNA helicase PcrA
MNDAQRSNEALQLERAINERYRQKAKETLERNRQIFSQYQSTPQNSIWVGNGPRDGGIRGELHPIIGRIAFDDQSASPVDGNLYIGPFFQELDGFTVICWATPVADLFYRGTKSQDIASSHVIGRRTFTTRDVDLIDFVDDLEPGFSGDAFNLSSTQKLAIPAPPKPSGIPQSTTREVETKRADESSSISEEIEDGQPSLERRHEEVTGHVQVPSRQAIDEIGESRDSSLGTNTESKDEEKGGRRLRAESLVRRIIDRPRTGKLSALLATLQEDQFELVTWPSNQPLIVSGQPGTGKTIVAMHRAAFLTHPQRTEGPLKRVVVVGPTDDYREHVQLVSESAGGARIPVVGMTELLCRIANLDPSAIEPGLHDRLGVAWEIRAIVVKVTRATLNKTGRNKLFEAVLRELLTNGDIHRECVTNKEISDWLLAIGGPKNALRSAKYLPLVATVGSLTRNLSPEMVDHLIVDEAQDVPPLVWLLLVALLKPGSSLTILGDINQRRSDWTASSWEGLAQDLELTDENGVAPIRDLKVGYRSTRSILKFANQLLPREQRQIHALREGVAPEVHKVSKADLIEEVRRVAIKMSLDRGEGLTAIISVNPRPVSDAFRAAGWNRPVGVREAWTDGSHTIFVFHPDRARGLEFDSVVVAEPEDFPQNVGRDGVLYTSLTRATQKLCIVYSGRLPSRLRVPKSR